MTSNIIVAVLVILMILCLPQLGYQSFGYAPSGGLGLVVVIILILALMGRL